MKRGQLDLNLAKGSWGGRRPGSGGKRIHSKGVAHRSRERVVLRTPVHINFKFRTFIRNKTCLKILKRAILNARKHGLQVVHYSLQSNHIHIVAESTDNEILTRGMRSLTVTFAKGVAKGRIQLERYHLHVLRTIREARNAIQYVLFNRQKHGGSPLIDEFSSIVNLKRADLLLRKFAKMNRKFLIIKRGDGFELPQGSSYLLIKGLGQLLC